MLRRLWSAQFGLFLAVWIILLIVGRTSLFRDPGTFWHVVVGQQILETGHVPHVDSLSFTKADQPWIAHQWLAEVAMALIHRAGGWDMLLLVTVTLLAALYAWIGARLLRAGLHPMAAVLLLALVLVTSTHNFHVRPLVVTIVLQAWTMGLLIDVESGRAGPRRLAWLIPVFILWSNLHGGVLGGIGTLGLAAFGWIVAWLAGRPSPVKNFLGALALASLVAACGFSVLVNPYGLGLPGAWMATMGLPLPELIQEHARLNPAEVFGWTSLLLGAVYSVVLIGARGRPVRVTWLLPLVWFVLACQRIRNLPLFAVTAALALADLLPHSRAAQWLASRDLFRPPASDVPDAPRSRIPWAIAGPVVLVAAALAIQIAGVRAPVVGRGWVQFDASHWPVGLLAQLQQINDNSPDATPIFNDLNLGGFVIYHAPRLRVFIDDRCALYGGELLKAYDHASREDPAQLDHWYQQYRFPHALVVTGTAFDEHLDESSHWSLIQRTPAAALYRRTAAD